MLLGDQNALGCNGLWIYQKKISTEFGCRVFGVQGFVIRQRFPDFQLKAAEEALNRFLCLVCTGL
jgi:hypothetical protein